jgi:ElaB/YqjD/DUF883 family membrane-anchored ribosome-binding protein
MSEQTEQTTHAHPGVDEAMQEERSMEQQSDKAGRDNDRVPLFATDDVERFRQRWESLQSSFVDQPRQTVEEADNLVNDLMRQLTAGFGEKRSQLEAQWEQGDEVSTEDLRVALTRYRSFFNRLLSV